MSNMKALITVALTVLPLTAGAHGIEFHTGFGFWHDLMHLTPYVGGALVAVGLVIGFLRWHNPSAE